MVQRKQQRIDDPIQAELSAVKRLLVLLLLKAGASQAEIGLALGVDQSTVSQMLPASKIKKFNGSK